MPMTGRRRRSELATPASNPRMCAKAAKAGADLVFLDLEDACAPSVRAEARVIAARALVDHDWGQSIRAVRVNGVDTQWCHDDIIDVIIVPKVRQAKDVWWVDTLPTQLEAAQADGVGAIAVDGELMDAAHLRNLDTIVRRAAASVAANGR